MLTRPDPRARLSLALRRRFLMARRDSVEFVRMIGRQEGDRPIRVGKMHVEWHRALDRHPYVVLLAPIGTGKSNNITRWRPLYELGRNPNLRIGILSAAKSGIPLKYMSAIKSDIERDRRLRVAFPRLRPQRKGQKLWSSTAIIVDRDDTTADPSIQLFGLYGKILGSRLDLIILDDLCNLENTMTETSREKMWDWVTSEVMSRMPADGGRVWAIGNTWHNQDVLHRLGRLEDFKLMRYSAFEPDGLGGERPTVPEIWTIDQLRKRERKLGRLAPYMMRNQIPDHEGSRIRRPWIEKCLERGRGLPMLDRWDPMDAPTFSGVDLAVGKKRKTKGGGHRAAIHTFAVLPDGTRRVLNVRSGRWTGPQTLDELVDVHHRYGSIIAVENNAAQEYLLQFASELVTLPLKGHNTGLNKHDVEFGVESLGAEFEQGKWMIPCDDDLVPCKEVAEWLHEAVTYTPTDHTGDRLIAAWIARECARKSGFGHGIRGLEDIEDQVDVDTLIR